MLRACWVVVENQSRQKVTDGGRTCVGGGRQVAMGHSASNTNHISSFTSTSCMRCTAVWWRRTSLESVFQIRDFALLSFRPCSLPNEETAVECCRAVMTLFSPDRLRLEASSGTVELRESLQSSKRRSVCNMDCINVQVIPLVTCSSSICSRFTAAELFLSLPRVCASRCNRL